MGIQRILHRWRALVIGATVLACGGEPKAAPILLFTGDGTSRGDVAAIEQLLGDAHLDYATADSRQLGSMPTARLRTYRLLIVPGGNFETMGNSLPVPQVLRIRNAIHDGLNYVGICAGAFFAGDSPYHGLNLTNGVRFPFYAIEARGVRKARVEISIADGSRLEQYWEDGPQLTGWGEVVARYDDGTPAITQGMFGAGSVVLLGTHPEAPESWRAPLGFATSGDASRSYATTLVTAALSRTRLPGFSSSGQK